MEDKIPGQRTLWAAVRGKDRAQALRVLRAHARGPLMVPEGLFAPRREDPSAENLLQAAVRSADRIGLITLLQHGAGAWINAPDARGRTAVHCAAELDDLPVWWALRNYSAVRPRAAADREGRTALHCSALHARPVPHLDGQFDGAWAARDRRGKRAEDYARETGKAAMLGRLKALREAFERRAARALEAQPPKGRGQPPGGNPFASLESPGDLLAAGRLPGGARSRRAGASQRGIFDARG